MIDDSGEKSIAAESQTMLEATMAKLSGRTGRVLMAEDDASNVEVAKAFFEMLNVELDVVGNGYQALEASRDDRYALVFMDVHMPGMGGYDATAEIRKARKDRKRRLPIIAMTANAMPGDRARCLEAGMDDYLSKPLMIEQLAAMLQKWLPEQHEGSA